MPGTESKATLEQLKQFYPMSKLPDVLNTHICKTAIIQAYAPDEIIFKRGQANEFIYYLVEGEVSLDAGILKPEIVRPHGSRSKFTLSSQHPHTVTASSLSDSQILKLPFAVSKN